MSNKAVAELRLLTALHYVYLASFGQEINSSTWGWRVAGLSEIKGNKASQQIGREEFFWFHIILFTWYLPIIFFQLASQTWSKHFFYWCDLVSCPNTMLLDICIELTLVGQAAQELVIVLSLWVIVTLLLLVLLVEQGLTVSLFRIFLSLCMWGYFKASDLSKVGYFAKHRITIFFGIVALCAMKIDYFKRSPPKWK